MVRFWMMMFFDDEPLQTKQAPLRVPMVPWPMIDLLEPTLTSELRLIGLSTMTIVGVLPLTADERAEALLT